MTSNKKTIAIQNYLEDVGYDPIGSADTIAAVIQYANICPKKWKPKRILKEFRANERWIDKMNSPEYQHAMELGSDLGKYDLGQEAIRAYEMGEIELWVDLQRARSIEEWDAFFKEHGSSKELHARWARPEEQADAD